MAALEKRPEPTPREQLRAARQETLKVFNEPNPRAPGWAERLRACLKAEERIAEAYGL